MDELHAVTAELTQQMLARAGDARDEAMRDAAELSVAFEALCIGRTRVGINIAVLALLERIGRDGEVGDDDGG
jgi:hypothetical protein